MSMQRANYERVIDQIKKEVKHVIFLEYCTNPEALNVEGSLLGFVRSRHEREGKWKT